MQMIRASSCVQAVNFLVNETFCHHPVMLEVDTQYRVLEPDYLLEWNGLKVPAAFDCDIFNNGRHWGNHFYFYEVPSRWSMCWSHYAAMKSGMRLERPELPIVDDEYSEQVAVYHSVLRASATQPFVMAELGARWGTWGSRAIAFLKQRRPELSYKLELVEAFPNNCRGVEQVMHKNQIDFSLRCERATTESIGAWLATVDHVDLIDIDIQGAEDQLLHRLSTEMSRKVYRLIIGTHSPGIHRSVERLFRHLGWYFIWNVPHQHDTECIQAYLRGRYRQHPPTGASLDEIVRKGCYHMTPRGPVAHWDGELIVDNPKFVHPRELLSMNDTVLMVGSLLLGS